MAKINNVKFINSEFLGNEANRIGHIQRIEDELVYSFKIIVKDAETPRMVEYLETTDFTKYDEYIKNPKVGKNTSLVWFDKFKPIVDKLIDV